MVISSTRVGRVALALGWLVLLGGGAPAAEPARRAIDVDRSDIQDRVVVHPGAPSLVTPLSNPEVAQLIPVAGVFERTVTGDLDGDPDTDLVTIHEAGDVTIRTNRHRQIVFVRSIGCVPSSPRSPPAVV